MEKEEEIIEFNNTISYLQKQLELFSNLCFGRNYVNRKYIKQILPFSVLMHYIWNDKLSPGIFKNQLNYKNNLILFARFKSHFNKYNDKRTHRLQAPD